MSATPYGADAPGRSLPTGLAVASLILGILGLLSSAFLLGGLLGLVAVILGFVAISKANRGEAGGKGMAIGGIITGFLAMLIALIVLVTVGSLIASNADEFSNLTDCLNAADTQAERDACGEEFDRQVNNP